MSLTVKGLISSVLFAIKYGDSQSFTIPSLSINIASELSKTQECLISQAFPSSHGSILTILNETPLSIRNITVTPDYQEISVLPGVPLYNGDPDNSILFDCPLPPMEVSCTEGDTYGQKNGFVSSERAVTGNGSMVSCVFLKAAGDSASNTSELRVHTTGYYPSGDASPADELMTLNDGIPEKRNYYSDSSSLSYFQTLFATNYQTKGNEVWQDNVFVSCRQFC